MRTTEQPRDDWRDWADCAQVDPEMWFPEPNEQAQRAIAVCHSCRVRVECLADALTAGTADGVWGGVPAKARLRLLAEFRAQAMTALAFAGAALHRVDIQAVSARAARARAFQDRARIKREHRQRQEAACGA